jgi:hypothetical protein
MDKHIFQGDEVVSDDDSYDASYDDNLVSLFVIRPLICSFTALVFCLLACSL